ncbi:MAG: RNA polymerase sigma factor [Methyloligellaceae bacterium]
MSDTAKDQISESLPSLLARLWRFALVLSGDPPTAEEVVHETCLYALENSEQLAPGVRLDRWTFAILYSIWCNKFRAKRIREERGFTNPAVILDSARSGVDAEEEAELSLVLNEVQNLPEAQRAAILLIYVEELAYPEAANIFGISVATVCSRLMAARETLGQRTDRRNGTG